MEVSAIRLFTGDRMKLIGVLANCISMLILLFPIMQIDLSLFKWTPLGYEGDGLQFVGLIFIFGFLVILELLNLGLFKGCDSSHWVVNAPLYLGIAMVVAVSFPRLLPFTAPIVISLFALACYFIYGIFRMSRLALFLSRASKFSRCTWLDYVVIIGCIILCVILAYLTLSYFVH